MSERMISETGCLQLGYIQIKTGILRIVQIVKNARFFSSSQGLAWILRYDRVPARGGEACPQPAYSPPIPRCIGNRAEAAGSSRSPAGSRGPRSPGPTRGCGCGL